MSAGRVAAAPDDSDISVIEVTARKRPEALAGLPQSITVYRGDDLTDRGLETSPELARPTPNLMWHSILGFSTPNIFLRGIGNTTFNANQAGPVGIHQDGVYQGSSVTYGFGLFDLDRVEILKGPQGTLFGRNTTGGVINFIPRKADPAAGMNAEGSVTYGRFDETNIEGAAGFALNDRAAVRMAGVALSRDGYVRNRNPASGINRQGKVDLWATRGQFRILPTDSVDILVAVHGGRNHSDVVPGKQLGVVCLAGSGPAKVGQCADYFGFRDSTDLRESFTNVRSFDAVDAWGADVTASWTGGGVTVVSQTAFDANARRLVNDSDAGPLSEIKTNVASHFRQFSQEVRALSASDGVFTWIAGANYYTDDVKAFQNFAANAFGRGGLSGFFPVEEGIASDLHQQTNTAAVFGEASYVITPRLTATLGGRWTYDQRDAATSAFLFNATGYDLAFITKPMAVARALAPTIPATALARDWSRLGGRAILSYEVADRVLTYASIARGFKGGDFNGGALFGPSEATIANPEYVTSYEVGLRGASPDGHITFDAAGFYYDFSNQQVSVMVPGPNTTLQQLSNAAKTEVKGLEANVAMTPVDPVFLEAKIGLLDATFKRFQLGPTVSLAGNRTASSPKFSFAGTARYTLAVTPGYGLSFQADANYKSGHFFTADNNPALYQPGSWLANGRVTLARDDGRLSLAGWVKNIGDKAYFVSGLANTGLGFLELFPGLPRTFGLTLSARY